MLPLFKRSEDHYRGASEFHGAGGEWRVEAQRLRWDILEAFIAACEQSGIPRTRDFNTGDNFGVDYFEVNQRSGVRWNASKAFLRPVGIAAEPDGAHRRARRAPDARRSALHRSRLPRMAARRTPSWPSEEVVLAAGAINSPQLLELSGIGAPEVLSACGIRVAHALPGVGENLQDHLQLRSIYQVGNTRTLNTRAASLVGKAPHRGRVRVAAQRAR